MPDCSARSPLISTTAAPPSFRPGALPAVIIPDLSRVTAGSLASASSVVSPRTASSLLTTIGSPRRCGIVTAAISFENRHSAIACAALSWLATENRSSSSRVSFACSAVYWASSIMWQSLNEHHSPSYTAPSLSVVSPSFCPVRPENR